MTNDDELLSSRAKPVEPGLYIVATPIGNARDITLRALDILRAANCIACEDTRVSARLLNMYGIRANLIAYHDHNAAKVRPQLIERVKNGEIVALISDAGTPLISDPGYKLVAEARQGGQPVFAAPGASAVLTALAVAGLPSDRFLFAGFAPPKGKARQTFFDEFRSLRATLIFYESPRRLAESLADMAAVYGPRSAVVARELTKKFEELRQGSLTELAAFYQESGPPKGEVVVLITPPDNAAAELGDREVDELLRAALADHRVKEAAALVAESSGRAKRQLYQRALELQREDTREAEGKGTEEERDEP